MKLRPDDKILLIKVDNGYEILPLDKKMKAASDAATEVVNRYPNALRDL
jgi:hypothetical protein